MFRLTSGACAARVAASMQPFAINQVSVAVEENAGEFRIAGRVAKALYCGPRDPTSSKRWIDVVM